jgi:hypothetical protein
MLLDLREYSMDLGMYPNDTRRQNILGVLQITDGGVYDNMGLEPVWKDHQVVMVSDGGAPFPFQNETDPFRRILRYIAITSNQAGAIRKRWLIAGFKTQVLQGTYWGVASGAASYAQRLRRSRTGTRVDGGELETLLPGTMDLISASLTQSKYRSSDCRPPRKKASGWTPLAPRMLTLISQWSFQW